MDAPRRRRWLARAAAGVAAGVGTVVLFVVALVAGVLLHLGTGAARRTVIEGTNRALAGRFEGSVRVTRLRHLGLDGVEGLDALVQDPAGRVVLVAHGIEARADLVALARSAARRAGPLVVDVSEARIHAVDAWLVQGDDGRPTVARALRPVPTWPAAAPERRERSRGLSLRVRRAQLDFAHASGRAGAVRDVDATVTDLTGAVAYDDAGTRVVLDRVSLLVSGLAARPLLAEATARAELPANGPRAVDASAGLLAGAVPVVVRGSMDGDRVRAVLDAPDASPGAVRELLGVELAQGASAHVEVRGALPVLRAQAHVQLGGGDVVARAELKLGPAARVHATLTADGIDPARVLARAPRGTAQANAELSMDLTSKLVDAGFYVTTAGLRAGGDGAGRLTARGHVHGALDAPAGFARVDAVDLRAGSRRLDSVTVEARGTTRAADVRVSVRSRGQPDIGASARLGIGGGAVDVSALEVTGLGAPIRGRARLAGRAFAVQLRAPRIDLHQLGRLAGAGERVAGAGSLDADVRGDERALVGHVTASVEARGLPQARVAAAHVSLKLAGKRLDGTLQAGTDQTHVTASLENVVLHGPALEPRSWRDATGTVDVSSDADLQAIPRLAPSLRNLALGGHLTVHARVDRTRPGGAPDATLDVSTRGLVVTPGAPAATPSHVETPEQAEPPQLPRPIRGVDVAVHAALQGASQHVAFEGQLADAAGAIVRVQAEGTPPLRRLLHADGRAADLLERTPFEAHAEVVPRDAASLPEFLRPAAVRGELGVMLDARGPVLDPRVRIQASAHGVRPIQAQIAFAIDGDLDATYDGRAAIVRLLVRRPQGVVLDLRSDVDAPIRELLERGPGEAPWDAGATVALRDFPLETVPQLASRGIAGVASGVVSLSGLHRRATLDADVRVADPRLGLVCFKDGYARLRFDEDRMTASTRIERPGSFADVTMTAAARWGAAIEPALDTSKPIEAALRAQDFRAAALMPFVEQVFDQLDGRIDADARVHFDPDHQTGRVDGEVRVSGASVEVAALGQPLHDVSARVSMKPWGTVRVDDVRASGATGRLTASAQAVFAGLALRSATADLDVERDQRMPLTLQGVPMGELSGRVHADASMAPDGKVLDVKVDVPTLQVDLPSTSGKSVQSLAPAPDVVIGAYQPDMRFVALPMHAPEKPREPGAMRVEVAITLGHDVRVTRDATLDVQLAGSTRLDVSDKSTMAGTLHLTRGMVDVFGKRFTIEPTSTVSFAGNPGEPQLVVTAMYEAPDRTHIYADVVGTPGKMKVNLRSEPALSQDEIVGLLMFGSPEGMSGTPPPSQQSDVTQKAAGLAGGFVTQGINKALSGITSLEVSTRVDTSQAANPRPEVEVRISNDVSTRVTVQTGMPAPGEPPDMTLLSIDWRFKPRWSLETTVGDAGSTFLDLFWNHRY